MTYQGPVVKGRFLSRPNRFIAQVELEGQVHTCHVKNTGRCKELLLPGAAVYLEESGNPTRKTKYDLIAVEKGSLLINMDSQAPNKAAAEYLPTLLRRLTRRRPAPPSPSGRRRPTAPPGSTSTPSWERPGGSWR